MASGFDTADRLRFEIGRGQRFGRKVEREALPGREGFSSFLDKPRGHVFGAVRKNAPELHTPGLVPATDNRSRSIPIEKVPLFIGGFLGNWADIALLPGRLGYLASEAILGKFFGKNNLVKFISFLVGLGVEFFAMKVQLIATLVLFAGAFWSIFGGLATAKERELKLLLPAPISTFRPLFGIED